MYQGKLEIVKREMTRAGVELLGISELRWVGMGHFQCEEFTVYYSGHESKKTNEVAIVCGKKTAGAMMGYNAVNDRMMSLRLQGSPMNITIVQVYAPTSGADDDVLEDFYGELQETIDSIPKGDIMILMGDFNAKIGERGKTRSVGGHGLGNRNDAGDRLTEFCDGNDIKIMNTWFKQPKRRLYTWTSPDGIHRNQIDYIMIKNRWASAVLATNTLPRADCGSDHELLTARIKMRLRQIK